MDYLHENQVGISREKDSYEVMIGLVNSSPARGPPATGNRKAPEPVQYRPTALQLFEPDIDISSSQEIISRNDTGSSGQRVRTRVSI